MCEYDSTWDTESDGDEPVGESRSRRSCQDKNKPAWTLVSTTLFLITLPTENVTKCRHGWQNVGLQYPRCSVPVPYGAIIAQSGTLMVAFCLPEAGELTSLLSFSAIAPFSAVADAMS